MRVEELDKPAGAVCPHARAARGCSTYRDRPTSCREFQCLWLRGLRGTAGDHRPDRLGLMLIPTTEPRTIEAREVWNGAAASVDALFLIHELRDAGLTVHVIPAPPRVTTLTVAGRAV